MNGTGRGKGDRGNGRDGTGHRMGREGRERKKGRKMEERGYRPQTSIPAAVTADLDPPFRKSWIRPSGSHSDAHNFREYTLNYTRIYVSCILLTYCS